MNPFVINIKGEKIPLEKPTWWDDFTFNKPLNEIIAMDSPQGIFNAMGDGITSSNKKAGMVAYFYYYKNRNEIPKSLIGAAKKQGQYSWVVAIYEGLLEAIKKQPSISDEIGFLHVYRELGEAYYELDDIPKAKYFHSKILELPLNDKYSEYQAQKSRKLLEELDTITDLEAYLKEKRSFRTQLDDYQEKLKNEEHKKFVISELWYLPPKGVFAPPLDLNALSNLELATWILVHDDADSSNPRIWTREVLDAFQNRMEDHYGRKLDEFEMIPMSIEYPTELSNKWVMHIPGINFDVGHMFFDGWKFLRIEMTH